MNIFANIREADKKNMLTCIHAFERNFPKGAYIMGPGEPSSLIGIVLDGSLQMVAEDLWGHRSLLSVLEKDDLFGETFACAHEKNYTLAFQAVSDCRVLFMDYSRVFHTCNMACTFHHRLVENMVLMIARKNLGFIKKIDVVSKLRIREKILTFLSQQAASAGSSTFTLPMNRVKMAEYLCVDRSALTRELSKMQEEGLICFEKNRFTLHIKF